MHRPLLVALTAVALTAACSSGTPPAPSAGPGTTAAPTGTASATATPAETQELTLTVTRDSVSGDTGTVPVALGKPVRLRVTSAVADEVHVHGVDVGKEVAAGGTVVLEFVPNAPGRFEVELERSGRVLTRLQVR